MYLLYNIKSSVFIYIYTLTQTYSHTQHSMNDGHEGGGSKSRRETGTDRSRTKDGFENPDLAYAQVPLPSVCILF